MKVRDLIIATLVIVAAVLAVRWVQYDRQVTALKASADSAHVWADSVKADAEARVALSDARAAAANDTVLKLRTAGRAAQQRAQASRRAADSNAVALQSALSAADSVPPLVAEVENLRDANESLTLDVALARAEAEVNMNRAIGAEADVHHLNDQITGLVRQTNDLNKKIQSLNPPPNLLSKAFTWTTRVLAVKGTLDLVRGH